MISLAAFLAVVAFLVAKCAWGIQHDKREDAKRTAKDARSMRAHARAINVRINREWEQAGPL